MGADMYYVYMGGTTYKIVTKFYRDCRGIPFNNPTVQVSFGSNGNFACGTYSLTATRVSIKDVSQICKDSAAPCSPQNTKSGEGVEEHIYETVVDISQAPFSTQLSASGCTEATFSFGQCCRNGALTTITPGDFWVTCTINFGSLFATSTKHNNSPVFANLPIIFGCCNQPLSISQGVMDTAEHDSVSFKLAYGLNSLPNGSVTYSSPYTYKYPFKPYCIPTSSITCSPNPYAKPPRGFYFDSTTGDVIFVPVKCDEVGILVIEASEYRKDTTGKMVCIGKTRRDMQLIIKECGYNYTPEFSSSSSVIKICEGDELCFNAEVTDATATPNQTEPDTVQVKWVTNAPGAKISVVDPSAREKTLQCCFKTKIGDASKTPYLLSITATDGHCPIPIIVSKTYKIMIEKCLSVKKVQANSLEAEVFPNPANTSFAVRCAEPVCRLEVFDPTGKMVLVNPSYQNGEPVSTSNWSKGLYLVKCSRGNQETCQKLLVH